MFRKKRPSNIADLPKDRRYLQINVVLYDKAPNSLVGRVGRIIYDETFEIPQEVINA